jgi:hypothetical protein
MDLSHVRWVALILAIGLLVASLVLKLQPSLLPKDSSLASELIGKVGVVTLCLWLAWPTIEALWKAPGGLAVVVASLFVFGLFVYRPKTIYLTGPFLAIAAVLALLAGWIRKNKR